MPPTPAPAVDCVRLATLNVRGLGVEGRVDAVLGLLEQHRLDVLFLEEVGLCAELLGTLQRAVARVEYRPLAEAADLHKNAGGWHQRGVVCITAWPMEVEANPLN